MHMFFVTLLFLQLSLAAPLPRNLGSFPLYSTSFLNIDRWNSSSPWMLLSSSFGVLSGDGVWIVNDIGSAVRSGVPSISPVKLTDSIVWPNEARVVPQGVIPSYNNLLSVCSGFLVPTKGTGSIHLIDLSTSSPTVNQISVDKSGFFYHRLRWFDVDGDGLKDILTCRANKPIFSSPSGELIWYKQPSSNPLGGSWRVTVIAKGCDFLWEAADLDNDGVPEILAAEFFAQKLSVIFSKTGKWTDTRSIQTIDIDTSVGPAFDVKIYSQVGSNITSILLSNHMGDGNGSVWIYEKPLDWKTKPWPKHTIANGFKIREEGNNQAAPGAPEPFYPKKGMTGNKWVALSGDGSQYAYQLAPTSSSGFSFSRSTLVDVQATVGQLAVEDVDEDGFTEIFVPAYDTGLVTVFSYSP